MSAATLGGLAVTRATVQVPAWGVWWADVETDQPVQLTGSQTLTMGGVDFVGTVMSGGPYQGRGRYRVAGGAGGWGRAVASRHYVADQGVRTAAVLSDLAADAGETIAEAPAGNLGPAWTREAGPAGWQLEAIAPGAWYVDVDGVTRFGVRTAVQFQGVAARVETMDPHVGRVTIASDDLTQLVPGIIVDGLEAVDVVHEIDAGKLRTTIWGAGRADTSRAPAALRRIVDVLTASRRWAGEWEYRVVSQSGERLNLQAVRRSTGLPDLRLVRVRLAPGVKATWAAGSLCLVTFIDGDRARPAVVAGDDPDSPGWMPPVCMIDASTTVAVGQSADIVELGSGTEIPPPANPVGRVIRYGDTIALPPPISADYVLIPGTVPMGVAKVSA